MSLCLLVTRRCDLRCRFCPLEFTDQDMGADTARTAVEWYLSRSDLRGASPKVKFFGGEPLLNWGVVRRVVEAGRGEWAERGLSFELATNGTQLDAEKLAWLRAHPEVEVTLSRPAPGGASLPGVWFTLVLSPSCRPSTVVRGLRDLLRQGYRRFNFLPAYYVKWTPAELVRLSDSFSAASRLIRGLWDSGVPVEVRNLRTSAAVPLFNEVATVDVDGTVWASNLVHSAGMEAYRGELRVGDVSRPAPAASVFERKSARARRVLDRWMGPEVRESTLRADQALTGFVSDLLRHEGRV